MKYNAPEMEIILLNDKDAVWTSNGMGKEDIGNGMDDDF